MPAPHRRNKGESLAEKIEKAGHIEGLSKRRDRQHAHRDRHAGQWEEAASRLDRPQSDLEQRAQQARTDHERAGHLSGYSTAVRERRAKPPPVRAKPPVVVLAPKAEPRYWLGHCLRCDWEMWVHSPKPRVPICDRCKGKQVRDQKIADQPSGW